MAAGMDFYNYKEFAMKAAKELGYGKVVVEKIKNAENENEIRNIMSTERHKHLD